MTAGADNQAYPERDREPAGERISWRCCVDGLGWDDPEHVRRLQVTGGQWRGHPARLDPWDQWCREQLPNGHAGIVYCADDGILRSFDPARADDLGLWCKVEAKSHMAAPTWADMHTLRAVKRGVALAPLVIRFDGDVPTRLYHWPEPCPACGAPGALPESSSKLTITVVGSYRQPRTTKVVRPDRLRDYLLAYFQHPLPAALP